MSDTGNDPVDFLDAMRRYDDLDAERSREEQARRSQAEQLLIEVLRSPTNHTGTRTFLYEPPTGHRTRGYTAKRLDNDLLIRIRQYLADVKALP